MNFFEKYPIFSTVCTMSALAFIAGLVLSFMAAGSLSDAETKMKRARSQFQSAQATTPSSVIENVEALDANLADLEGAFQEAVSRLESTRPFELAGDSDVLLPTILKYVRDFQARAKASPHITAKDDEAFGFSNYARGGVKPPPQDIVPIVDKQRQILTYIVQRLFDAANESKEDITILSVGRKLVEQVEDPQARGNNSRRGKRNADSFIIDDAVTAKVDGAIETLAFKIEFSGYTEPLRLFIESMSDFDLPVVIRSVEVSRKEEKEAKAATKSASKKQTQQDALQALFGSATSAVPEELAEPEKVDKTPIVDKNDSEFTVILEYVEVSLESEEE